VGKFIDTLGRWFWGEGEPDQDGGFSVPEGSPRKDQEKDRGTAPGANVVPLHPVKAVRVCVYEPQSIDDVRGMADQLKNRRLVVINFENTQPGDSQRIIDFLGGVVYALEGRQEKINQKIFMAVPSQVEFSMEPKDGGKRVYVSERLDRDR
jgi:cell division inhibitor SepF